MKNLDKANKYIKDVEITFEKPRKIDKDTKLKVGVDLGTSNIVLTVLDENNNPIAGEIYRATVVRDGIVVDYLKAVNIVSKLKASLERKLGRELNYAATAIPPGISSGNIKVIKNVVEGAGFIVTHILDEPTAAANVLEISEGAVVDIGGGTTGVSILKNNEVIFSGDEATGGHHLSLVLSGALELDYYKADDYKIKDENYNVVFTLVRPVIEKMANIILNNIRGYDVDSIYLVGGTCCLKNIEQVIEKYTDVKTIKPYNPLLVTPIGICMSCDPLN